MNDKELLTFLNNRIKSFIQPDGTIKITEDYSNTLISMAKIDMNEFYRNWSLILLAAQSFLENSKYLKDILLTKVLCGLCYLDETRKKQYLCEYYELLTSNPNVTKIIFKYDTFNTYSPLILRAAIKNGNTIKIKEIVDILFFERNNESLDKLYNNFFDIVPKDSSIKKKVSDVMEEIILRIENPEMRDRIYVMFIQHQRYT